LSRTWIARGAGSRAPPQHGWQPTVSGEHDRLPDRPGAAAGDRRPVEPLRAAGGHRVADAGNLVAAGGTAGGGPDGGRAGGTGGGQRGRGGVFRGGRGGRGDRGPAGRAAVRGAGATWPVSSAGRRRGVARWDSSRTVCIHPRSLPAGALWTRVRRRAGEPAPADGRASAARL